MTTRRDFLKTLAAAGLAASLPSVVLPRPQSVRRANAAPTQKPSGMIWANLLHLSTNMWEDHPYVMELAKKRGCSDPENIYRDDYAYKDVRDAGAWANRAYRPFLIHESRVWDTSLQRMADAGMNMVVIDLGDAVRYESHPEIAVRNAWSPDTLRAELAKIRSLGLEPIPKLNFAATHDAWLGEYSRMVSTQRYYDVCRDLIREVCELFDRPRLFHLGMDEEVAHHQRYYDYVVIRQNDLWWKDLYFYIDEVEKGGARAWLWSDYGWHYPDLFFKKMPKSVLQSNWYYRSAFGPEKPAKAVTFYDTLETHGYDQLPTGSNYYEDGNMDLTVSYCRERIAPERLKGFMTAPWLPNLNICLDKQSEAIDQIANARSRFY